MLQERGVCRSGRGERGEKHASGCYDFHVRVRSASLRHRLVGLVVTAALGPLLGAGCGDKRPAVSDNSGSSNTTVQEPRPADGPPGCGVTEGGAQCDCVDVALYTDPPTMYFVLDRSGSMAADDNWNKVRTVVAEIMRTLGPRAKFGATTFPAQSNADACGPGNEVLKITQGDPPSATTSGPVTIRLLNATLGDPRGSTPTSATIAAVHARLSSVQGKRYVILATDGAPNCNLRATCTAESCQSNIDGYNGCSISGPSCCDGQFAGNCNDEATAVSELKALYNDGIESFVIGLPVAPGYAKTLDNMAVAGGDPLPTSPRYYAVGSSTDSILGALKTVAAKITATCDFDLTEVPADPALVNVYIDEVVVPYEPVNGWTIEGKKVTLQGTTCARVKAGDALDVRIIAGCPRVILK